MGVVRRQGLKHTIVNMAGLAVGGLSVLFLYPHVLKEYGLMQVLLQVGILGLPLFSMGAANVVFRFFPDFKNKANGHNGFLPLLLSMCLLGSATVWLMASFFWNVFSSWLHLNSPELGNFIWLAVPISFFYVINATLTQYSANFNRIVVPSLLFDFSQKLVLPILLGSIWLQWINLETALYGLLFYTISVTIGMILYLNWLGEWYWKPNWAFLTPNLRAEILRFIGVGTMGGFFFSLAVKSEIFMVGTRSTLDNAGKYAVVAFMAAVIEVPTRSLYGASIALVAKHNAESNLHALGILYRKVSINLLIAGLLLFGAIWISADALFAIFPNKEAMSAGKYVLLFTGLARVVEMGTGLNNHLIYYSKYYYYNIFCLAAMGICNIALSLWLIPKIGITGAALSTLCSVTGYNLINLIMVWVLFRLQPFTKHTLWALGLALLLFALVSLIPVTGNIFLDIILRSGAYALLYAIGLVALRISPDLNEILLIGWRRVIG